MSRVFLAEEAALGRQVVIKVLPPELAHAVSSERFRQEIRRRAITSIPEAVSVPRDVARALAYAHEHGVIHRDIKPDNILLSGGTAAVTDFGVAKALTAATTGVQGWLTSLGVVLGTLAYMPPGSLAQTGVGRLLNCGVTAEHPRRSRRSHRYSVSCY